MKLWKRNAVVSTIILFVCVALYLSWSYGRDPIDADKTVDVLDPKSNITDVSDESSTDVLENSTETEVLNQDFFSQLRLERQKTRDNALAIFNYESGREDVSPEAKTNMLEQIQTLGQSAINEASIEVLIKSKGYADCIAVIGNDGIEIIIAEPADGLKDTDVAIITDAVTTQSKFTAQQLTISPASMEE